MYIEDSGTHDIKVIADGQEYHADANYDSHHDGHADGVLVQSGDGYLEYTDSHGTGEADVLRHLDSHGNVTSEAHFDASTGHWIAADPHSGNGYNDSTRHAAGSIVVDTPDGDKDIGPATVDTSGNGVPDTAVVHNADGSIAMYTDTHGTGQADVEVIITKDGEVTVLEHTGKHQWVQVEHGHIDGKGTYTPDSGGNHSTSDSVWGFGDTTPAEQAGGAVRIDAITGQWVAATVTNGIVPATGDSVWG